MDQLVQVLQWRQDNKLHELSPLIDLAISSSTPPSSPKSPTSSPTSSSSPIQLIRAQTTVGALNRGSLYWHGLTKDGRPILWFRANRLPWFPNVQAQINALILLADLGIEHGMPTGRSEFVVLCHCENSPPPHPKFAYQPIQALTNGYPDRIHQLWTVPVSGIVDAFIGMIKPLLPERLSNKLIFVSDMEQCRDQLVNEVLWNGKRRFADLFGWNQ